MRSLQSSLPCLSQTPHPRTPEQWLPSMASHCEVPNEEDHEGDLRGAHLPVDPNLGQPMPEARLQEEQQQR